MSNVEEFVDESTRALLLEEYHGGRLTPRQAFNVCRDRGVGVGLIDAYDMADWLRNSTPPSLPKPEPAKKATKKKVTK